ncbi:hypothetical protein OAI56_00530 [Amylibacter sp.]|nr:hypothetical protein [Amylibacter sp.]
MLHSILKKLRLIKVGPERLSFGSRELLSNSMIWSYLSEHSTEIGGALGDIIEETKSGNSINLDLAGGTIAIPSGYDCDFNLYNHFKEYFQVDYKIPMFLYHTIGSKTSRLETAILSDYEVYRKTFKGEDLPQVVAYFTMGPNICWGRHSRWRAQFDICKSDKSTAVTNHACHDWAKSDYIYCDLGRADADSKVLVVEGKSKCDTIDTVPIVKEVRERKNSERQFKLHNGNAYNFLETSDGQLSGNHIVTSSKKLKKLTHEQYEELERFRDENIIFNAYVVPGDTSELEFGLWWPSKNGKIDLQYLAGSSCVNDIQLDEVNARVYRSALSDATSDLVIWQKYPGSIDETYSLSQPMLIVKNKVSGDSDFTEFQSCWRNQGFESEIFPHWLGNFKAMKPSSRLTGVVNFNFFDRGQLILQALRPKGCGDITGSVEINIFDRFGRQIEQKKQVVSNTKCLDFDFAKGQYGPDIAALRVRSTDIDFTANLVQWNTAGATSIQHLWGY